MVGEKIRTPVGLLVRSLRPLGAREKLDFLPEADTAICFGKLWKDAVCDYS